MKIMGRLLMLALLVGLVIYAASANAAKNFHFFQNVAKEAGVDDNGHGKGVILFDYDGDGRVDIFKSNKGGHNVLYHNDGNGKFTNETVKAGLWDTGFSMGSVMGDLTNDGHEDLIVAKGGRFEVDSVKVYKGLGNGKFKDVTESSGLAGYKDFTYGALLCDFDHDGKLDLFLSNYGVHSEDRLFHNESTPGHIKFRDVTKQAGLGKLRGWSWSAQAVDVNEDGWDDLYVCRGRYPAGEPNKLYLNVSTPGHIRFADYSKQSGLDDPNWTLGATWADYDHSGHMSVYISNYVGPNRLMKGDGTGHFTDVTHFAGLDDKPDHWGKGPCWVDINNSGYPSLYEADCKFASQLYLNDGNGKFTNITEQNPDCKMTAFRKKGVACGDIYGNGSLDLYVVNWAEPAALLRNLNVNKNWIEVDAKGTISNMDGVGTKIRVFDAGHMGDMRHYRGMSEVQTATGFCAQNPLTQHFGVDHRHNYDIEAIFPSGLIGYKLNVHTAQRIKITEPRSLAMQKKLYPMAVADNGLRYPLSVAVAAPYNPGMSDVFNASACAKF